RARVLVEIPDGILRGEHPHIALGFCQRDIALVSAFGWLPLFGHTVVPSGFRLQVNPMTQEPPSEFLLITSGIQHRVPRRTLLVHPAFQLTRISLRWHLPNPESTTAALPLEGLSPFAGDIFPRVAYGRFLSGP